MLLNYLGWACGSPREPDDACDCTCHVLPTAVVEQELAPQAPGPGDCILHNHNHIMRVDTEPFLLSR